MVANWFIVESISCFIILLSSWTVMAEFFTSMVDMESLFETEKQLPILMDSYLKAERSRLKRIKELSEEFVSKQFISEINAEGFLENPVNIYHLIKRLTIDVNPILNLMLNTNLKAILDMEHGSFKLPNETDLNGVSIAISRLQTVYKLNTSILASGIITPSVKSAKELSADDCYEIGHQNYLNSFYYKAIPWFEEALTREANWTLKTENKELLLEYLAECYMVNGNKTEAIRLINELLLLNPNSYQAELFLAEIENEDENVFHIGLDKSFEYGSEYSEDHWQQLCRNESNKPQKGLQLNCYYSNNNSPFLILQPIKIEELHQKPWVALFYDVVTKKEIELIKKLSTSKLERALVASGQVADYRTSKSGWLDDSIHPNILRITKRLQEISGLNLANSSEEIQVANYGIGGHYEPHVDYAPDEDENPFQDLNLGNRIATILIYLSNVTSGGRTVFPHLGIGVNPQQGMAIFWYNVHKTGKGDPLTEHAACPVLAGIKWVSNKWIHTFHQEFRKPCGLDKMDLYHDPHIKSTTKTK